MDSLLNEKFNHYKYLDEEERGTFLLYYTQIGHIQQVALLLEAGANANVENKEGETPLMISAGLGDKEIVKMLIYQGKAQSERKDKKGLTALSHAINIKQSFFIQPLPASLHLKEPCEACGPDNQLEIIYLLMDTLPIKVLKEAAEKDPVIKSHYDHFQILIKNDRWGIFKVFHFLSQETDSKNIFNMLPKELKKIILWNYCHLNSKSLWQLNQLKENVEIMSHFLWEKKLSEFFKNHPENNNNLMAPFSILPRSMPFYAPLINVRGGAQDISERGLDEEAVPSKKKKLNKGF